MATDYRLLSRPPKWISAHRDNNFVMSLPSTYASSGYNDGSGYLKVNLSGAFPYTLAVGDRVYLTVAPYIGYHIVKTVHSSIQYTFETAYVSSFSGAVIAYEVVLPEIRICKGYKAGEIVIPYLYGSIDLSTIQPYKLIATIKPEAGIDGFIRFNICGFTKTVIEAPYIADYNPDEVSYIYPTLIGLDYTPKRFNKVRLEMNGGEISTHLAANASVSTQELNRDFVDTGRPLGPLKQPTYLAELFTVGDYIVNEFMINFIS